MVSEAELHSSLDGRAAGLLVLIEAQREAFLRAPHGDATLGATECLCFQHVHTNGDTKNTTPG